ncbi:MAG: TonB family protein [Prevotella sp.]|nr:TonB family protein [Prevotella sp.]
MARLLNDNERVRKSREADLERQHTTGFLMGLILVLAILFVALEWNSSDSGWTFFDDDDDALEAELELSPLHRDEDEVPMMVPDEPQVQELKSEEVNAVEEQVDVAQELPEPVTEPVEQKAEPEEEQKPEAVDMYDEPLDFRVVEDLPQFPGGAVEFMKWLTKNLKYPVYAQQRKVQGRVVAQFTVNIDGSITDLELIERLDPQCDREALRVLRMMPRWKAGVQDAKPCRTRVCIPIVFKL